MIDLRDSTVLVNNVKEYRAITKIAKKQGFRWASGDSLNSFNGECKVYYNSSVYFYEHNYQCRDILNTLGRLILKRKEG